MRHRIATLIAAMCSATAPSLVSAAATPLPVVVTNPSTSPVQTQDVDTPARNAWQYAFDNGHQSYTVPTDKRLTIEFASVACDQPAKQPPDAAFASSISTTVGGTPAMYMLVAPYNATGGDTPTDFYRQSLTVRVYADPGSLVYAFIGMGGSHCDVSVSGYLVPK